jgi:hypothetical protein
MNKVINQTKKENSKNEELTITSYEEPERDLGASVPKHGRWAKEVIHDSTVSLLLIVIISLKFFIII